MGFKTEREKLQAIAWFLAGEGSFSIIKFKRARRCKAGFFLQPTIQVVNIDLSLLKKFQEMTGMGKILWTGSPVRLGSSHEEDNGLAKKAPAKKTRIQAHQTAVQEKTEKVETRVKCHVEGHLFASGGGGSGRAPHRRPQRNQERREPRKERRPEAAQLPVLRPRRGADHGTRGRTRHNRQKASERDTSKTCCLCGGRHNGRVERGSMVCSEKHRSINADVNGAVNVSNVAVNRSPSVLSTDKGGPAVAG